MIGWWYWCWWQWYSKLYWDETATAAFQVEPVVEPPEPPVKAEAANIRPVEEQPVVVFTAEEWARLEFMRRLVEQGVLTR